MHSSEGLLAGEPDSLQREGSGPFHDLPSSAAVGRPVTTPIAVTAPIALHREGHVGEALAMHALAIRMLSLHVCSHCMYAFATNLLIVVVVVNT
jgi:hypothetical protein